MDQKKNLKVLHKVAKKVKDDLRFAGVHYKDDYMEATDSHRLVRVKLGSTQEEHVESVTGERLDNEYPYTDVLLDGMTDPSSRINTFKLNKKQVTALLRALRDFRRETSGVYKYVIITTKSGDTNLYLGDRDDMARQVVDIGVPLHKDEVIMNSMYLIDALVMMKQNMTTDGFTISTGRQLSPLAVYDERITWVICPIRVF